MQEYKATKKQLVRISFAIGRVGVRLKLDVQGQGGGRLLDVDGQGGGGGVSKTGQFSWTLYVYHP